MAIKRIILIFLLVLAPSAWAGEEQALPAAARRGLFQKLSVDASWTPSTGSDGLGMTKFGISATFALPGPQLQRKGQNLRKSFFLITPKFEYTNVDWEPNTKFPDSLFNIGVSFMWMQPIDDRWSFMAGVMPAWSSDGDASKDSFRCPAMFGFTWTPSNRWKFIFGAAYLDRSDISVIPYAGAVWTPNEEWRVELTAPQARINRRLTNYSDSVTQRWIYLGGGFSGGSWAVRSEGGRDDYAMYREFPLAIGYDVIRNGALTWNVELAYIFGRRMEFDHDTQAKYKPDDSVQLRMRFAF